MVSPGNTSLATGAIDGSPTVSSPASSPLDLPSPLEQRICFHVFSS